MSTFGEALRSFRERSGISQSVLAKRSECNHSMISRIESGTRMPSVWMVGRVAEALDLNESEHRLLLLSLAGLEDDRPPLPPIIQSALNRWPDPRLILGLRVVLDLMREED